MAIEIEAKLKVDAHEPLRERLRNLGAVCTGRVKEHNHLFDSAGGELRAAGCGLRVRQCEVLAAAGGRHAATLTYKGPRQDAVLKVRQEIEVEVSDGAHAIALLGVDEVHGPALDRANILRVLAEIGASAIEFEGDGRLNVYARVNPSDALL